MNILLRMARVGAKDRKSLLAHVAPFLNPHETSTLLKLFIALFLPVLSLHLHTKKKNLIAYRLFPSLRDRYSSEAPEEKSNFAVDIAEWSATAIFT